MVCVVILASLVVLGLVDSKDHQEKEVDRVPQVVVGCKVLLGAQVTRDLEDLPVFQDVQFNILHQDRKDSQALQGWMV